jgi:HK97 family phage portal protein
MSHLTLLNLEQPKITANGMTELSLTNVETWEDVLYGIRTHSGQLVTPAKAKRCSAVLACMRILSEDLSTLPLLVYKRLQNGSSQKAVDHSLYSILDLVPNELMTSIELREHMIFDLITAGNFFNLINEDPETGEITSLWPLQAQYCQRMTHTTTWNFSDPTTGVSGQFTPDTVWRGTILSDNGVDGQAITLLAREAIGLLLAGEEQAARLFAHGIQSDFALQTDANLEQEDVDRLESSFVRKYAGARNAFRPIILDNGLKSQRFGLTAQESQYIEARNFQISDVARIFRIPEVLLGGGGASGKASTFASAEQFFNSYVKHTLLPWARRIEQTCNRDLLNAKDRKKYFIAHDFSALLRGDTAARYAAYSTGIASGFLSPNECRIEESKMAVDGLDYYTRPLNTEQAAGEDAKAAPTDQSARRTVVTTGLQTRVAELILRKEQKGLSGRYASDPAAFYSQHTAFVEDITGADLDSVMSYTAMRVNTADKFSAQSRQKALESLIQLCNKG